MAELARFDARDVKESRDEVFAALARDGGAIVEHAFDTALIDALVEDFTPHFDEVDWSNADAGVPDEFFGFQTKRLHGLLRRSPRFADVILSPLLLAMSDHFLSVRCREVRISTGELMVLGEGETNQLLHRDADSWPFFPAPRPEILVSGNVALTDFTETNGATRVVPGSHLWPPDRKAAEDEVCLASMPKGSVLLYSGNVLHGGGSNRTGALRIGLYVGYLLSWLRPIENHLITNGPEAILAAPQAARELLDWTQTGWQVIA